jgi:hypothetical protein
MLRWLGLKREDMIAEVIASYEGELEIERSRLEVLKSRLVETRLVADHLEQKGEENQARSTRLVVDELEHRVRVTEELIARMEGILEHFREEHAVDV